MRTDQNKEEEEHRLAQEAKEMKKKIAVFETAQHQDRILIDELKQQIKKMKTDSQPKLQTQVASTPPH
jgi:hypothetical protein